MAADDTAVTMGKLIGFLTGEGKYDPSRVESLIEALGKVKEGAEKLTLIEEKRAVAAQKNLEILQKEATINAELERLQAESLRLTQAGGTFNKIKADLLDKERRSLKDLADTHTDILERARKAHDAAAGHVQQLKIGNALNRNTANDLKLIENLYRKRLAAEGVASTRKIKDARNFISIASDAADAMIQLDPVALLRDMPVDNAVMEILTGVQGIKYADFFNALDGFTTGMDTGFRGMVRSGINWSDDLRNIFDTAIDPMAMAGKGFEYISQDFEKNMMLKNLGFDGASAAKALSAVKNNVSLLRNAWISAAPANQAAAAHIISLTQGLAKLGVAETDVAQGLDFFMKGLGQTPLKASESVRALEHVAHTLDINVGQAFKDFNSLSADLAQWGDRSVEVFANLQAQAVATGVDVGSLATVAGKLDTFKGAAVAAQGFNAVLGKTVLSVTDLVHAEPAEKIELLKQAMDRSGISFDTAHRRIRAMVAGFITGGDVAKAAKLFGSEQDYFKLQSNLDGTSTSMSELDERVKSSMTSAEKMKATLSSLGKASSQAVDVAREAANKASVQLLTTIGSLGEKAKAPLDVLIALRQAMRPVVSAERVTGALAGTGMTLAGWTTFAITIGKSLAPTAVDNIFKMLQEIPGVPNLNEIHEKAKSTLTPGKQSRGVPQTAPRGGGLADATGVAMLIAALQSAPLEVNIPIKMYDKTGTKQAGGAQVSQVIQRKAGGAPAPVEIDLTAVA